MKAWFSAHIHASGRAATRLYTQPMATTVSILVIGFALTLPFALYVLFSNLSLAASRINSDPNVSVYLALTATEPDARELEKQLKTLPEVSSVKFVSRDAAIAEMKRIPNLADLLSGLEANPLPHAFVLRIREVEPAKLALLKKNLAATPKIEHVVADFEWAQKLKRFAEFAGRLVILLWVVLGSAMVFVTGNTIRLQTLTQRDEIELSQLIGATRRFICRPFLYFGAFQGLLAGAVAVGLVATLTNWAGTELHALMSTYGSDFQLRAPTLFQSLAVVALSACLGWLGAYLSVWLYWRSGQLKSRPH